MPTDRSDWVVLKFGGTSVATRARWDTIAAIARKQVEEGQKPLLVCSALSGISNALERLLDEAVQGTHEASLEQIKARHLDLADALGVEGAALLAPWFEQLSRMVLGISFIQEVSPRLHAQVMALGELMSTVLGAAFLSQQGLATRWLDARQWLKALPDPDVHEGRRYLSAVCDDQPDPALQAELTGNGAVAYLTQGFIAANEDGETVLLGRGGSDTSAAYFAAKLQARRLEIWTDVPGMFTANPHQIPSARLLYQLGYDEAQELATMGGKVLHPRCLDPVRRDQIPLHIRSTEAPELDGTVISGNVPDFGAQVKAISAKAGVTLVVMDTLGMWQQVGFLARVFETFKRHGLSVDLIATSETNLTVSLDAGANALEQEQMAGLLRDLNQFCRAREIGPCAIVSLIGRHIRSILHELGPAFLVFDEQHIYLVSQAASDLNFSFVVDEAQADRLVRKLHAQLFADREKDQLFGPTWRELFSDEGEPAVGAAAWWRIRRAALLKVAESQSPAYVYDEQVLRDTVAEVQGIDALDRVFYAMKANPHEGILRLFYDAGLGFECVSPGEVNHVRRLFPDLDPARLLFTPNFAPRDEYAFGFEACGHVTLDSVYPLEAWPEVFEGREVIVRMDPGRGHGHHKHVRTAGAQSKFGVAPSELDRLQALAEQHRVEVIGLHAHVGSGIVSSGTWFETARFLASLTERFPKVRLLNLGGGLGVVERPGAPALDVAAVAESLAKLKQAWPNFELWMEPGRYLVARAGVLLARVTQVKQKGPVHYVGLETGMNSLIRPALYGSFHEIVNLTRLDDPFEITAQVVGPICETGDVLGYSRRLPATYEGDLLLIATAGAYGRAMSSRYNLREPAAEVMLRAEHAAAT